MNAKGFTLIEMLAVVAIVGILAGLFIPQIQLAIQKAHQKGTMKDMNSLATALTDYAADRNDLPAQSGPLSGGSAFLSAIGGFYLKAIPINDQWGTPLQVYCGTAVSASGIGGLTDTDKEGYLLRSFGRDKAATDFDYNPADPSSTFFPIASLVDFNEDLVSWNGSWIHVPNTAMMGAGT